MQRTSNDLRSGKRGGQAMLSSNDKQMSSKGEVSERDSRTSKPKTTKLAEDSMTEQSEDDRGLNSQRGRRIGTRSGGQRHGVNGDKVENKTVSSGGNVTNIINNNNINNYIISDPTKAPPVFHMAAQTRHGMNQNDPRMQGIAIHPANMPHNFNNPHVVGMH